MTVRSIILEELNKIKGKTFIHGEKNKREITINFEIEERRKDEITLHIDKSNPDYWRTYWHLQFDGGMEELRKILKERNDIFSVLGGAYVNKEGKEYGSHGCYIQISYCEPIDPAEIKKISNAILENVLNKIQ